MMMQIKGTIILVLVYVVALASIAMVLMFASDPLVLHQAGASMPIYLGAPYVDFSKNGTDTIISITFPQGSYLDTKTGMWEEVVGDAVELEIDGGSQLFVVCDQWECLITGEMIGECVVEEHSYTLEYNLGEVTGTPPLVRARIRSQHCFAGKETGTPGQPSIRWSDWSDLKKAVPYQPPIIEAAIVIGAVSIAIGVGNNYLQGRRERQATEVTRTAAEDERFMDLYDASREAEFQRTMAEVLYQYEWTDYDDFQAKYGPRTNIDAWAKIQSLAQYFEGVGVLVDEQSVNIGRVYRLLSTQIVDCWEKLEAVIMERRKRELNPAIYDSFERLYYAIQKYRQEGPPKTGDEYVRPFKDYTPTKK